MTPEEIRASVLRGYGPRVATPVMPEVPEQPFLDPNGGRPQIGDLYDQLMRKMGTPTDFSGVEKVAKARKFAAQNDLAAGMALSSLGGSTLQPLGHQVFQKALADSTPLRPNAADIGYENPETGGIVENPVMAGNRNEKMLAGRIDQLVKENDFKMRQALAQNNAEDLRITKQNANTLALIQASIAQQNANTNKDLGAAKAENMGGMKFVPGMVTQQGGPVYRNPRGGPFLDGSGQSVVNPISVAGETKAVETTNAASDANTALTAIIAQAEKDPGAFGIKGALTSLPLAGGAMSELLLTDAQRQARAAVMEQASNHMRTLAGQAVSAQEKGRIEQFIPAATDPFAVVMSKLKQGQNAYKVMLEAQQKRLAVPSTTPAPLPARARDEFVPTPPLPARVPVNDQSLSFVDDEGREIVIKRMAPEPDLNERKLQELIKRYAPGGGSYGQP